MDGVLELGVNFTFLVLVAAINALPVFLIVATITSIGRRWFSARARFMLWTLVLVRMVLPCSCETCFGLGNFPLYWIAGGADEEAPVVVKELSVDLSLPVGPISPGSTGDVETVKYVGAWYMQLLSVILYIIYLGMPGISLLIGVWLFVTSWRLLLQVRSGKAPSGEAWNQLLADGRKQLEIRLPVRLRILTSWNTPATFGVFLPTIILPADADSLSKTEMRHVLWHELSHIKRGDAAWNYLWVVVRCLHWWNPFFWWVQRCWLAERELACDALVIQHLETSPTEYGRTLLHFLERLSKSPIVFRSISVPGLVLFLGEKGAVRRRLQELAKPSACETAWGRWCSFAMLVLLAGIGLTDAASPKQKPPLQNAINVPSGTLWQFGPDMNEDDTKPTDPTITRVYDVSKALARIQQDLPAATAERDIRDLIQGYMGNFPWINGKPQGGDCSVQGNVLSVRATELQHAMIKQQISQLERFGQRQITIEVRFSSTDKELSDFLPALNGTIFSPPPRRDPDPSVTWQSHHTVNHSLASPSFVRVLSEAERESAAQFMQGDQRSNTVFAPKITLFAGATGNVSDTRWRPFVTGLRTTDLGDRQPQVSKVGEGIRMAMQTMLVDGPKPIQLNVELHQSEILDVEVLKTRIPGESGEMAIQIPHVSEMNLTTIARLGNAETLLVSPLRRDKNGNLHVFMITPRLIEQQ